MMRLARFVCMLVTVVTTSPLWAVEVSPSQARTAAQNWVRRNPKRMQASFNSWKTKAKMPRTIKGVTGRTLCHVVDMEEGGFVVTSGDTKLDPIIAFSSSGDYNSADGSPLEALLSRDQERRLELAFDGKNGVQSKNGTAFASKAPELSIAEKQWAELLEDDSFDKDSTFETSTISDTRVPALLVTKWDQSTWGNYVNTPNVYNYYTPNNYVCGCTSTSGSQIMKYWEFPKDSIDSFKEVCTVDGLDTTLESLAGKFNWNNMPLSYSATPNPTDVQRQALGMLTYNVGVAIKSSYSENRTGSTPSKLSTALKNRFGYVSAAYITFGPNWIKVGDTSGITDFENALYASLDAEMPVNMGIFYTYKNGGHSIVADGYGYEGGKRFTHLNMGWSGQDDVWYDLPNEMLSSHKYDEIDNLVYNIHPYVQGDVISGRVLNFGGSPVSGATVNLFNSSGARVASTNANSRGIYSFRITSAGSYSVAAQSGSLSSGTKNISIPSLSSSYSTGNRWGNDLVFPSETVATGEVLVGADGTTSSGCIVENDNSLWKLGEALPSWINSCSIIDSRSSYMMLSVSSRIGFTGSGTLSVSASENTGTSERTCVLSVSNTTTHAVQYRITVRQSGRPSSYTITFNANGGTGSMAAQSFSLDVSQRLYANGFTRNGYKFQGWANSASGSVVYYDQQNVIATSSMTLYAVWAPLATYTVTFNANGGAGTMSAQTFTQDIPQELRRNVFTRSGYEFLGWAKSSSGAVVFYDEQILTAIENMTLYAIWRPTTTRPGNDSFVSAAMLMGAVGSTTGSNVGATYEAGDPLRNYRASATNTVWWAWTAPSSGEVQFSTDGSAFDTVMGIYVGSSVSSLEAKAQDDDGGSGTTSLCSFMAVSGTTYYISIAGFGGSHGDISLSWQLRSSYTVTFNANSGVGTMSAQTFTDGIEQPLRANEFTKSGSTFVGWTTNVNGAVVYSDKQSVIISKNLTLYARWSSVINLSTAVDNTVLSFTTGGASSWFGQTSVSADGVDAVQSGAVSCGQTNWMETTVSGPGQISFKWFASCYYGDNGLEFTIDGKLQNGIAGNFSEWSEVTRNVVTGTHTLRWQFSRAKAMSSGSNCGWVDQIVWTPHQSDKTYTVKFNRMDYSGVTAVYTFDVGETRQLPKLQDIGWSYSGHVFLGWTTNNYRSALGQVGVVHYTDGASVKDLASTGETAFLYAVWGIVDACTVSFDANGGIVSPTSKAVSCDSAYGDLPTPTREGYFFEGWYTAANGSTKVTAATIVTSLTDHTLYAHWTTEPLTALSISPETVNVSASAGYAPSVSVSCDNDWSATTTDPWIIIQWAGSGTTGNKTLLYRVKTNTSLAGRTGNIVVSSGNLTVVHTVNQGGATQPTYTIINGELINVRLNGSTEAVIPDGVKVIGGNSFYGDEVNEILEKVTIPSSVTNIAGYAFAHCKKLKAVVIPDSVVSIGDWAFCDCAAESLIIGNGLKRIGKGAFCYWRNISEVILPRELEVVGEEAFEGCSALSSVLMPRIDYAENVFEACNPNIEISYYDDSPVSTFVVTYAPGSYGSDSQQADIKTQDVALTLKGAVFTRTGYTQTGWATSDGGEKVYNLSSSYTANDPITLYPFWTPNEYTVTFDANGGSVSLASKPVTYDSTYGELPTPTLKRHSFDGWFTEASGGTQVTASTKVTITSAQTLYAHWTSDYPPSDGPWGPDPVIGDSETAMLPPTWLAGVSLSVPGGSATAGSCVAGFDASGVMRAYGVVESNGNLDICVSALEGTSIYWRVWVAGSPLDEIHEASDAYVCQAPGGEYGGVEIDVCGVASQTIMISRAGWNLVSFNVLPDDPSPDVVFADVADSIQSVVAGTRRWTPQSGGRLVALQIGVGYWVKTNRDNVEWTISGTPNENVAITVSTGWNLIGYPLLEAGSPDEVLKTASEAGIVSSVVSGTRRWTPESGGRLSVMTPGVGYWLKATKAGTIVFDK